MVDFRTAPEGQSGANLIRLHCEVVSVFQSRVTGYRAGKDSTDIVDQARPWFVQLAPLGLIIPVGYKQPSFQIGDALDLVLAPPDTMQE